MIYIELAAIFLVQILILIRLEMVTPAPEREIHPAVHEAMRKAARITPEHRAAVEKLAVGPWAQAAQDVEPIMKKQKPRSWSEVRQKAEAE